MRVGVNRWAWGCGRVALLVACRVCGCGTGVSLFTAHEHSQTPTPRPPLPGQQVSTPPTGVRRIRFMPVWSNDLMCGTGGQPSAWMILQLRRMSSPDQWGDGFWLEFLSCELGRHCQGRRGQEAGSVHPLEMHTPRAPPCIVHLPTINTKSRARPGKFLSCPSVAPEGSPPRVAPPPMLDPTPRPVVYRVRQACTAPSSFPGA